MSPAPRADGYERRRPEATVLYQCITQHWPPFAERIEEQGGLPKFVHQEFDAYGAAGAARGLWRSLERAPSKDQGAKTEEHPVAEALGVIVAINERSWLICTLGVGFSLNNARALRSKFCQHHTNWSPSATQRTKLLAS